MTTPTPDDNTLFTDLVTNVITDLVNDGEFETACDVAYAADVVMGNECEPLSCEQLTDEQAATNVWYMFDEINTDG